MQIKLSLRELTIPNFLGHLRAPTERLWALAQHTAQPYESKLSSQVLKHTLGHRWGGQNIFHNTQKKRVPQNPVMEEPRHNKGHGFLPVWTSVMSSTWVQAPHPGLQKPEEVRIPSDLISQDHRITELWKSWCCGRSNTTRNTGSLTHSRSQLRPHHLSQHSA